MRFNGKNLRKYCNLTRGLGVVDLGTEIYQFFA